MLHETPATPGAGSAWGIRIACDPPTQRSSHAGDDDFEVNNSLNVIPAQAGIQCLCFNVGHQATARFSRTVRNQIWLLA
jgi:hypothetical protein